MNKTKPDGSDLVMTQAELPPGIDAPTPSAERQRIASGDSVPADVAEELRHLAKRAGGFTQLRTFLDEVSQGAP